MNKKKFSIVPRDRFLDGNSRGKRLYRARNSKIHNSTAKSLMDKDFSCQKKVKFTAQDADASTTCRLEVSPIPLGRKEDTTCANQPKTSEYAFFKKLKEGAGQICHSNSLQKDAYLSKKPEPNDCFRERTNNARISSKCFDHSTIIENTPTVKSDSFLPPSGGPLKKTDEYLVGSTSTQEHLQGYGDTFQPEDTFLNEEAQSEQGKTFLRKRQKLRQWVADTSFPDTDKFCSKRHDIVSMLLTRLISDSNEENKYNYPKSGTAVTATSHGFPASQESDIQYKEHHIPGKKLLELDSRSYSSDHLSSPMFQGLGDRKISCADFLTNHSNKSYPYYTITEPECDFAGTANFSPHRITDPEYYFSETARITANRVITHGCLFNEQAHKTSALNDANEPGSLRGELYPLPLENCLDSPADELNIRASHDWDIRYKEQGHVPRKKLLELEPSSYSSDHLASPIFQRSDDRIIQRDDFSIYHSLKFYPSCSTTEPDCNFGRTSSFSPHCIALPEFSCGEKTPFRANSDMTHGFQFNELEHKTPTWNHLNESWKHGRGPYPLLLENGLDSPAAEIPTPINHNNAKLNRSPVLFPSIGNCEELMLYNTLGARQLCPSSILPNQPLDLNSLDSGLLRYQEYRFGKYVYDGLDTDFNHNSLSLSSNEGHLKLLEERQSDHSCVPGSFYLSRNQHLFRGTVSHHYHHQADASTKAWLSSSLNFFSGRRYLSLAGPHPDHQIPNYGTLQLALRERVSGLFHFGDNYEHDPEGVKEGDMLCQFKEDALKRLTLPSFTYPCKELEESPFLRRNSDHISDKISNTQDSPTDTLWFSDRS
ncbi:hypothetical protein QN277_012871 [Acacia crassicarpa]|uniref:Uncharacterized protein n=1 Tax=Acacia crassicarpa TaxID=499986 RepID=A0AAE1N1Z5_9FABA|nr:hypothetical protein QN277_012871 [Acacia crassicarpa]